MKELIASFNVTRNLDVLKRQWEEARRLSPETAGTNVRPKIDFGGRVQKFFRKGDRLIGEWIIEGISQPNGFYVDGDRIVIASMQTNSLVVVSVGSGRVLGEINNRLFNDLHSVVKSKDGFLVTSSGTDTILEVDEDGKVLWLYNLVEKYPYLPGVGGKRELDLKENHVNRDYPTLQQTTHVNSAIFFDQEERFVLSTLFHQGELILIDKSKGDHEVVLRGLSCPHSIRKFGEWFSLVSSRDGRVLLLDSNLTVLRDVRIRGVNWVQDVVFLDESRVLVADSNNHRFVIVDIVTEEIEEVFTYSRDWRVFQVEVCDD